MDPILALQAEVMKTMAHPRRLQMLHRLAAGPVEVTRLASECGISQPNASQHLAVLRSAGLVEAERDGREIRYRLADPEIVRACDLFSGVLRRHIGRLAQQATQTGPAA
jgi:ArsR family transcriptional regulator